MYPFKPKTTNQPTITVYFVGHHDGCDKGYNICYYREIIQKTAHEFLSQSALFWMAIEFIQIPYPS